MYKRQCKGYVEICGVEVTGDLLLNGNTWQYKPGTWWGITCLLYTSDAADDLLCVDLGGRRIIKKKKHKQIQQ